MLSSSLLFLALTFKSGNILNQAFSTRIPCSSMRSVYVPRHVRFQGFRRMSGEGGGTGEKVVVAAAEPEKMTIKLMWERYGMVAIGTHFAV